MRKILMLIVSILLLIVGIIFIFIDMREDNNMARKIGITLLIIANLLNIARELRRLKDER